MAGAREHVRDRSGGPVSAGRHHQHWSGAAGRQQPGKVADLPQVELRGHGHAEAAQFPARGGIVAAMRDPWAGDQHRLGKQRGLAGTARRARGGDGEADRGADGAARQHLGGVRCRSPA